MKVLQFTLAYGTHLIVKCKDHAIADAAYEKTRAAMAEYKEFSNDRGRVVTVDFDFAQETIRLAELLSVSIEDAAAASEWIFECAVSNEKFKARVAAAIADPAAL